MYVRSRPRADVKPRCQKTLVTHRFWLNKCTSDATGGDDCCVSGVLHAAIRAARVCNHASSSPLSFETSPRPTKALLDAITAACAIPEAGWRTRKSAFNAIAEKAPLRTAGCSDLAITHSDIPGYLEREWYEFNTFSKMTKNITNDEQFAAAVKQFWLMDDDINAAHSPEDAEQDEAHAPR